LQEKEDGKKEEKRKTIRNSFGRIFTEQVKKDTEVKKKKR
jgi:hypothetical protein